jgi:thiamine-monophosphate kinase
MAKLSSKAFDPDEFPKWIASFWGRMFYGNIVAGVNDDDCAVIKVGKEQVVITTDYLNANPIAMEMGFGTYKDLGRLVVAANLSDLCGTGAKPIGFLSALTFKKGVVSESDVSSFFQGMKSELKKHKIPLIGGDTKLGNSNSFCGIAIGVKEKKTKLYFKNGAKPGDSIWISSEIGAVGAAIIGLNEKVLDSKWIKWAQSKIVQPDLPLKMARKAASTKIVNGGTDLSDGLAADLWWMCEASSVGAILDVESIPVAKQVVQLAQVKNVPPWFYALTIGGDFQFIITAKKKYDKDLEGLGFIKIGEVTHEQEGFLKIGQKKLIMPRVGHRDIHANSFSDELAMLIDGLNELLR